MINAIVSSGDNSKVVFTTNFINVYPLFSIISSLFKCIKNKVSIRTGEIKRYAFAWSPKIDARWRGKWQGYALIHRSLVQIGKLFGPREWLHSTVIFAASPLLKRNFIHRILIHFRMKAGFLRGS